MAATKSNFRWSPPLDSRAVGGLFASLLTLCGLLYSDRPGADPLHVYLWNSRVVVVAAPSSDDPALRRQRLEARADAAGWADRRLILLVIADGKLTGGATGSEPEGEQIRRRLGLGDEGFSLALVGLDGTVKLRRQRPVSNDELYALIDAMPMRREELRRRTHQ